MYYWRSNGDVMKIFPRAGHGKMCGTLVYYFTMSIFIPLPTASGHAFDGN